MSTIGELEVIKLVATLLSIIFQNLTVCNEGLIGCKVQCCGIDLINGNSVIDVEGSGDSSLMGSKSEGNSGDSSLIRGCGVGGSGDCSVTGYYRRFQTRTWVPFRLTFPFKVITPFSFLLLYSTTPL